MTDRRERDEADLKAALDLIRTLLPTARTVELLATDQQNGYGFLLISVKDSAGTNLLTEFGGVPGDDKSEINELISDLDWYGVVGEDEDNGSAVIAL